MRSPFYEKLDEHLIALGGLFNAHLHLDRAGTFDDRYFQGTNHSVEKEFYLSLHEKHHLIRSIHNGPAYDAFDLEGRINNYVDQMVACGTRRLDTLIDTTADRVGLDALEIALSIKASRAHQIDMRVAAYSPLGFRDDEPERWSVLKEGAEKADFISALPESDDHEEYPEHIGFMEHCRRFLELSIELDKPLHVHTDQRNQPTECGTERLIEAVRQYGSAPLDKDGPSVWAVHMISPSTYDEARFESFVEGLLETNIGVICCPSAAIGMRQIRPILTPTYNSIPRLLELAAAGVPIRLASDNIADICSPSTTADLRDEVFILSAALRFYDVEILASFAAGKILSEAQKEQIRHHLEENEFQLRKAYESV
ncbi:MAG: hypothetical protein AAF546_09735 [Verrucomicrobiota bacterium]